MFIFLSFLCFFTLLIFSYFPLFFHSFFHGLSSHYFCFVILSLPFFSLSFYLPVLFFLLQFTFFFNLCTCFSFISFCSCLSLPFYVFPFPFHISLSPWPSFCALSVSFLYLFSPFFYFKHGSHNEMPKGAPSWTACSKGHKINCTYNLHDSPDLSLHFSLSSFLSLVFCPSAISFIGGKKTLDGLFVFY